MKTKLMLLFLALPQLAFAVREGRLLGKVVGPDDKPIEGVTVTVTAREIPSFREVETTNKKGVFKVDFDRINVVYRYRFEKDGYRTTEVEQNWQFQGTKRHVFTIEPGVTAPAAGSGATVEPPASKSVEAIRAYNAGAAAFRSEDWSTAAAKLRLAVGHDPKLRQAWEVLSAALCEVGEHAAAATAAEEAIALGSTDPLALRSRWRAYHELGDQEQAAAAKEELERLGSLTAEANKMYNSGVAMLQAGDEESALARFKEALEVDPNHELALIGVATLGMKIGRPAETWDATGRLLAANPAHERALKLRYNASLELGEDEKIFAALLGLGRVDPGAATERLFQLAKGAFEADDAVVARKRLAEILDIDPDHARSHYLLGLILMREGQKRESRHHMERFLALTPDDPDAATASAILDHL